MHLEKLKKSRILIVDDKPENLDVLIASLKRRDYAISVALTGEKAIALVKESPPDIILLDVIMPGIDGFETCRRLKEDARTKDVPIIFMTALSDTVDEVTGFELGGVDYVTKPFKLEKVLARVKAHLTIQSQKKALMDLNATKDQFFSIIAHDLRNPLFGLISLIELELTADQLNDWIKDVEISTKNMFKLLENLLDWANIQQGQMKFAPTLIPLHIIVSIGVDMYRTRADQKGVRLESRISSDTTVYGDIDMIETVIRNLLNNAVKFCSEGDEIVITEQPIGDNFVEISVADTGIGMSEVRQKKLFRIGERHKNIGTDNEKGTGLGLILCKEFVEKNGGNIWAESQKGEGSTFRFTLPAIMQRADLQAL
ncbi:MAG: hypothetical protein B6244_12145 [Candidatus Cloacimonetes bacterium 4572_55]|nr:MAG: hypothetical protein B6244_12145 [Candidatus Cloacimonetes bacterium 4572_55]